MSNDTRPPSNATTTANIVTTSLAGALNLLVILVLCFLVMPTIERSAREAEQVRDAVEESRQILGRAWKDMEFHRAVLRRLTDIMDAAEAAKKAKEKANKKKGMGS